MSHHEAGENEKREKTKSKLRSNLAQILAASIKNMLLLSFGVTLGFPTILIPGLQEPHDRDSFSLSQETISWIGSIHLICIPVGCAMSGTITEYLGRKRTMQLVNVPFLCAWIIFRFATSIYMVFVALCLTGLSGGLLEAPVLTYVAEICEPRLRGILSCTTTVAVIGGVLFQFFFGTYLHWRTVALVNCIFPIISFLLLFIVPESPHWLILKNRILDARKSIAWLRGWTSLEEIEPEFVELCKYIGIDSNTGKKVQESGESAIMEKIMLFTKTNFLWPYMVISFCFLLGNFSGMSTLQTYAVQIFATLRSPVDKYVATIYLGVAEIIGCTVCVCLVRKLGKRKLYFTSIVGNGVCFLIVATYAYCIGVKQMITIEDINIESEELSKEHYNWIPLVFLILSAFLSHTGMRVLPWILIGEFYSNETRASGSGVTGATAYVFGFLANKTFLSFSNVLSVPGIFWFNSAVSFIGCALLFVLLPETEGKPLQEITSHFKGEKRMKNSVRRKKNVREESGEVNRGFQQENNLEKESNVYHM